MHAIRFLQRHLTGPRLFFGALVLTFLVYLPGLQGSWLFDDFPNIVDNKGVQPADWNLASLVRATLSSPASDFKRPLASLSFAVNFLMTGLDPFWMKLTNVLIHLCNGGLVYLLAALLIDAARHPGAPDTASDRQVGYRRILAALIAMGWMLLPINLTAVLYVVQRMESLANLFVLIGLLGYVAGRQRMLADGRGLWRCVLSLLLPTALGLLAKETAVMLPLYAFLVECVLFRFRRRPGATTRWDGRVVTLFGMVLVLPLVVGLAWLLPRVFAPDAFATRDFTMSQRLLSEARIVVGYLGWTVAPLPHQLSFYHDDFNVSHGWLTPWTTLTSCAVLVALAVVAVLARRRLPLLSLGLALFLGAHVLTGTIMPLELIYEHRNYFASFGLLLALVPMLYRPDTSGVPLRWPRMLPRAVLGALMLWWLGLTAYTAREWGEPLRLARALADRAPDSPRAEYELGRTYIVLSHYDRMSPYTRLAYAPLEKAASLPDSSILPQQALIFMNARMGLPLKDAWWDSLTESLAHRIPGVQDESSLAALARCAREQHCPLPQDRMAAAFEAALAHPHPDARITAAYGEYAWYVMDDRPLGERMLTRAVAAAPDESAYRITLVRMLLADGKAGQTGEHMQALRRMNVGDRFQQDIDALQAQIERASPDASP